MAEPAQPGRPNFLVVAMLIAGLGFAAYRAWAWPEHVRPRLLTVVAPSGTDISIVDGPTPEGTTQGVHTWQVNPGPLTLQLERTGETVLHTNITIPKGIGGLMLNISFDETGELQLGYF